MNTRATLRHQWLHTQLERLNIADLVEMIELPGDASFRKYFRIVTQEKNYLLMDAPPEKEDSQSFVAIAQAYRENNLLTPAIFAHHLPAGFLLIEDFGKQLLSDALNADNAQELYRLCYQALPKIQACQKIDDWTLPDFVNHLLESELLNFKDWCVHQFAELTLSTTEEHLLQDIFQSLKNIAAQQPQVGVHRDYHSRNLMILSNQEIGIIDFQDAVIGPLTYDLVSLLRDCYIRWPEEKVETWIREYYHAHADCSAYSLDQFEHWVDWQGIQRHLKAIFIFCRKFLRDSSTNYLNDIPRTLEYIRAATKKYPELRRFHEFIEHRLVPPLLNRIDLLITRT